MYMYIHCTSDGSNPTKFFKDPTLRSAFSTFAFLDFGAFSYEFGVTFMEAFANLP